MYGMHGKKMMKKGSMYKGSKYKEGSKEGMKGDKTFPLAPYPDAPMGSSGEKSRFMGHGGKKSYM